MKTPRSFSSISCVRVALAFASLLMPLSSMAADPIQIVVPGDRASVDPDPNGGCCEGNVGTPSRSQYRIPAADFGGLDGPCWITGSALRVDAGYKQDVLTHFERIEIRLSTTTVGQLKPRFADNVGEDETVVFDNELVWRSEAEGRTVESWDLEIRYENWFLYDPSQGDLLADSIIHSGWSASPHFDFSCFFFDSINGDDLDSEISRCNNQTWGDPTCPCIGSPPTRFTLLPISAQPPFLRGDSDGDGTLTVGDPIINLMFQFTGTVNPPCLDALDFNDSGNIDVSDPIANLSHQFLGLAPPAPPGKESCDVDPTPDKDGKDLGCNDYPEDRC